MPRTGRPTRLNDTVLGSGVLDHNTGTRGPDRTVRQVITDTVRATGVAPHLVAGSSGVAKDTVKAWLTQGETVEDRVRKGHRWFTPREQAMLDFLVGCRQAKADWEIGLNALHAQHAQGGAVKTITTIRVLADGTEERTTRTETLLADPAAIRWELERKGDGDYRAAPLEVTGRDGDPLIPLADPEAQLDAMMAALAAYEQGVHDGQTSPTRPEIPVEA